jgi:hypothetical protein
MRCRALALELLISISAACSAREDVAAIIVGDGVVDSNAVDASSTGLGAAEPADTLIVIGQPLGTARWAHPIAPWPLSTPLREFFADAEQPSGKRVRVEGPDASALDRLWQAVKRGEYGPQMSAAVAEDADGEQYLLVFQSP